MRSFQLSHIKYLLHDKMMLMFVHIEAYALIFLVNCKMFKQIIKPYLDQNCVSISVKIWFMLLWKHHLWNHYFIRHLTEQLFLLFFPSIDLVFWIRHYNKFKGYTISHFSQFNLSCSLQICGSSDGRKIFRLVLVVGNRLPIPVQHLDI